MPTKKILTKDSINSIQEPKAVELNIPEWNGSVYVRVMVAADRDAMGYAVEQARKSKKSISGIMVAHSLSDENGNRIYTDEEGESILSKKSNKALDRIIRFSNKLNLVGDDEVQTAVKN